MIKLSKRVLCLDWDRRAARVVQARVGGGRVLLEEAHARRVPANVDIDDPAAMGAFLKQTLERHNIKLRRAIVDVPRDRVHIHRLTLQPTPDNEVAAAVRFQAARELPYSVDEAQVDFVVMQRDENGRVTEVLLAAARLETLSRIQATLDAAGLTVARVGLRPYANMVSVGRLPGMLECRVLFVDVGPQVTEIDVFRGQTLSFSRAASVSVPFVAGELLREDSRVLSKQDLDEGALAEAVERGVVDELLVEVTRTLQAFRATESNAPIDQIIVAGGAGVEEALVEALSERFGLPTMLFDPTGVLGVDASEAAKLQSFSAALGLTWGLSAQGLLELDFLNPKKPIPAGQSLKRRMQLGGIAAVALLGGAAVWAVADFVQLSREVEALVTSNDARVQKVRAQRTLDVKSLEAMDWDAESRMGVWLDHLLDLTQQAIDPGKQMLVSEVGCDSDTGRITLKLLCSNWEVATDFVKKLNELEVGSKRIYRAKQGSWQETSTIDPRFKGRVDVTVELIEVREHLDHAKQRQTERAALIKNI